jgi:glycosyltransferase involved in cell wall biosynthesis
MLGMKQMRVLIAANSASGLYKFRRELLEALLGENHEVIICLPYGDYIPELEKMGCKFLPCEFDRHGKSPVKELKQIYYYMQAVKNTKPDIAFTYTIKPNVYCGAACAALKVPYVANITGLGIAVENGGLMQKITLILYKFGLRKAQKVFFQNAENRDFMIKHGIVKRSYDLLPGSGVNLKQFEVLEYPVDDTIEFAFISRIMKEKGIDQYLVAANYIRKKYPTTRFHVCGFCEQAYENKLSELDKSGIISYHGMVRDTRTILKNIHCTIHPTYYPEGISNVLLESCACGRPIITTDRSGCREVIENGMNGYVVKQKDSCDLIEKIEMFLALSPKARAQMGLAGRAKVEMEFERNIVVRKYLDELAVVKQSWVSA